MASRMRSFTVAAALLAALCTLGHVPARLFAAGQQQPPTQQQPQAQQPPATPDAPQPPPIFRAGINFVRVDVIISDKTGNPAPNLKQPDFEAAEEGKPQKIETFKLVKLDGG